MGNGSTFFSKNNTVMFVEKSILEQFEKKWRHQKGLLFGTLVKVKLFTSLRKGKAHVHKRKIHCNTNVHFCWTTAIISDLDRILFSKDDYFSLVSL